MGRYLRMSLADYDADIRSRLNQRSRLLSQQYRERSVLAGKYQAAQRVLSHDPDFSERRISDEWTGRGRSDSLFLTEYQNKLHGLVQQDLSKNGYWRFVSSWLNDKARFGSRPELDHVLWVKFLLAIYDLPFIRSGVFGIMLTPNELDTFRFRMRVEPFLVEAQVGKNRLLTSDDIDRVMSIFDSMKANPNRSQIIADTQEDMVRFREWVESPISSDLTGRAAVERALEPIHTLGTSAVQLAAKPETKTCPGGHTNPLEAKYCGYCEEPYRFPEPLPICPVCKTTAFAPTQKRCNECGALLVPQATSTQKVNHTPEEGRTPSASEPVVDDDPFAEQIPLPPKPPVPPKSQQIKWGKELCHIVPNAGLIDTIAINQGYPYGSIESSVYLPESREAYEHLKRHFAARYQSQ